MTGNVTEVVPFLHVEDMRRSLAYYVDGLAFTLSLWWPDDKNIRWCRLACGEAAIMLQEFRKRDGAAVRPQGKLGLGLSLNFTGSDALAIYREVTARGIAATEPFVGNGLWTFSVTDPDGYIIWFASPTDTAEETKLSDLP